MRLTHLEIFGFKSFAQKVEIPFDPGITAIVGPNGCGKSNIVEAIRWVLGEQRVATFRSQRMEEVIFGGARERRQLGMAEVALTIENSHQILPIEFREVTLTRRLFRSGDSDYLLNKVPCRLLDIHNLLMDTGLGQGAYAVMEQGMVDEIISEKTENRRRILEEAAGITKYKVRRRSTRTRLESTTADLTRIEDIIAEVKRQVTYLSRQVGRARRYQVLKQELDEHEILFGRLRFFAIADELQPLREELDQLNRAAEQGYTHFTSREAELEKLRLSQTGAEAAMQEVGLQLNSCIEEIHGRERRLDVAREQLSANRQALERATREQEDYGHQLQSSVERQSETARSLEEALQESESTQQRLVACEQNSAAAERAYNASRDELDRHKGDLMDLLKQQSQGSGELERARTERQGLLEHAGQLQSEGGRAGKEREQVVERARQAAADLEHIAATRLQLEGEHRVGQERRRALEERRARLEEQRGELRRAIAANEARQHVMEKVRSGYEGYSSGVRALMLDSPHAAVFQGVLGDLIEVEPEFHHAVEAALGDAVEALVAADRTGILEAIDYLKEGSGRAGVFPLEWQRGPRPPRAELPARPGLLGPLARWVRAEESIAPLTDRLLHNTFLVQDLATAAELAEGHVGQPIRLVTPAGDAIDAHGRIVGGQTAGDDASLLGRRQEIRALKSAIAHDRAQLATVDHAAGSEAERSSVLSGRLERLSGRIEAIRGQEAEQLHLHQQCQAEAQRLQERLGRLDRESSELRNRAQELEATVQTHSHQLRAVQQEAAQVETRIRDCEERRDQAEGTHRRALDEVSVLRVEQTRVAAQIESLRGEEVHQQRLQGSLRESIQRVEGEAEQAGQRQGELTGQEQHMTAELEDMHGRRETLRAESDRCQEEWNQVTAQTRDLEEQITKLQRQLNSQRERRHQVELEIDKLESRAVQIEERLHEDHECDVAAAGPPETADLDPVKLEGRIEELRQSIQRLGPVHVGVLEEHEEQKERYEFLCEQRDDLLAAAEDLNKTLSLIDRTARRMFREIFQEIRVKFMETFERFFPGGEADLQLQPDVDALEADIYITARPRGKRLQAIGLLSGGERALTAIALLFAIYLVKPSPFCILDEVDAPLDDVNVGRFVRVLKEFARTTQFIMVTHNKISMHAADALHGVTMPEEGVSQLVSVRMDDEAMTEAAG